MCLEPYALTSTRDSALATRIISPLDMSNVWSKLGDEVQVAGLLREVVCTPEMKEPYQWLVVSEDTEISALHHVMEMAYGQIYG